MIRSLRILFLGRPAREKILGLALLVGVAGWWLLGFVGRAGQFVTDVHDTSLTLSDQHETLTNRDRIERQAKAEAALLDSSRTLDGPRLSTALSSMASTNNLTFHSTASPDTPGGQFVIHSVEFNITGAPWEGLKNFYREVEERAPYISVESFAISANKANPNADQLNASLRVSSVEIRR